MEYYIKFTPFYDYNDNVFTSLSTKFPSLREEQLVNIQAICCLYNEDNEIIGVVLCKHETEVLVLQNLFCLDNYDEKPFIMLICQYVGNGKCIILQTNEKEYDRLNSKPFIMLICQYFGNEKCIILQTTEKDYDRLSGMVLNTPVVTTNQQQPTHKKRLFPFQNDDWTMRKQPIVQAQQNDTNDTNSVDSVISVIEPETEKEQ